MQGRISLIFASDLNGGIGYKGELPWSIPEELKIFREKTMGKTLVMGRKTAETLPKLDGDRKMYVLSRKISSNFSNKNDYIFSKSIEDILEKEDHIFVIGGGEILNLVFNKYRHLIGLIHHSRIFNTHASDVHIHRSVFTPNKYQVLYHKSLPKFDHTVYKPYVEEKQYLDLLHDIIKEGYTSNTRNGITHSLFGKTLEFNLIHSFPLITTKKMFWRGIVEELLMFIRGDTDTKQHLEEKAVMIWAGNTSEEFTTKQGLTLPAGDMGPMYGYQWRHFNKPYGNKPDSDGTYIDQLKYVVDTIKSNPTSRRIMMTTFNPAQVNEGVLYPCHSIILQFNVEYIDNISYIDTYCYNRSSDVFLGLPFNIASTTLLIKIIGKLTGTTPRKFTLALGNAHIYFDHTVQAKTQMAREPYSFPDLVIERAINTLEDIQDLQYDDFKLKDYKHYSNIRANMKI